MAKRELRTWIEILSGNVTVSPLTPPQAVTLIQDDGASIGQGKVRLCRLIGCVNLAVTNVVIASPNLHFWHGVVNADFDTVTTTLPPYPGGGDANAEAWLWREPISLWPTGFGQNNSIDDFIISVRFDWQFRGGRGSSSEPETRMSYIMAAVGDATPSAQMNMRAFALFTST